MSEAIESTVPDVPQDAASEVDEEGFVEAEFDDVDKIIEEHQIGTFIVPLSSVDTNVFYNSRCEDSRPATIAGIQATFGGLSRNFDTSQQIQEVSVGHYGDLEADEECGLGVYVGFTRIEAMKRDAQMEVIAAWNDAMGYSSPNDEGYVDPSGTGMTVGVLDVARARVTGTSDEWAELMQEAVDTYPVRIRVNDVSSREAYAKSVQENAHRSEPSTGAKAASCAYMRDNFNLTGAQIASDTKLLQAHVSQYLLIADIPKILLAIVEEYGAEDSERELLARCIEEWGRRTYLPKDDQCAILISHARVLGPALRGHAKNSVDMKAALDLMCELCRVDEDGKINRKASRPDLATFTSLVNSAKEHGAATEIASELASDEIAGLIAKQAAEGGSEAGDNEIDDILSHIDDAGVNTVNAASTADDDGAGIDIGSIIGSAEEVQAPEVAGPAVAPPVAAETPTLGTAVEDVSDVDAVAVPPAAAPVVEGEVDFGDLGDLGGGDLDTEGAGPSDTALADIAESVTGEKGVASLDASEIAAAVIESKPRSTLLKKAERALLLIHTAVEDSEDSDDPVVRLFGCRPALTICQLATSAALSDAANESDKDDLNAALSSFLDSVDTFMVEAVKVAAESLNSVDFAKLSEHAEKIDLDSIM